MNVIFGEIISIGSELLTGGRTETNSLFLAERLAEKGIQVRWKTIVGDVPEDIAFSLKQAITRATVVILTGGLGSTVDDCTREVVADVMNRPLRKRKRALDLLTSRFDSYGRKLTSSLKTQASIPLGAELLENPVGSALGFLIPDRGRLIAAVPGVSREAQAMFDEQVVPKLNKYLKQTHQLKRQVLQTFGLTESEIDDRLTPVIKAYPAIIFGLLTSPLGVSVTLSQWSALPSHRQDQQRDRQLADLDMATLDVRNRLGDAVYAEGSRGMEEIVGQSLRSEKLTLSLAESCTGGLIGHRLTQVPGSSHFLDRSLVCYSNQAKQELLGVPKSLLRRFGAVSSLVARAMARGVRSKSNTALGLSVTGIAGPGGGTKQKPVGLVFIALDSPAGTQVQKFCFHGDRGTIKMRASQAALDILRKYLLKRKGEGSVEGAMPDIERYRQTENFTFSL